MDNTTFSKICQNCFPCWMFMYTVYDYTNTVEEVDNGTVHQGPVRGQVMLGLRPACPPLQWA